MRILQIRFKNLNSLVGEWSIDLTQPDYLSEGLFAITGPTGAGKSTILDAICLGLYGCTPRLGRITKSANDIMSRHTGECFAQITFETQHGQFESTWSQHRARKKAEGELQNPQHKLINITQKQTLAEKLLEVSREIEGVTGLDFERFTRSILLAQGSFAAFLQASSDERAPILEQITGTQIYSEISIKTHERSASERKKLAQLQAELKNLRLLDQQEEQQLHEQLAQSQTAVNHLNTQIRTTEEALSWRQQLAQLEQELAQINQAQQLWLNKQYAFQPEQQRLQQALQALELAGDYQTLVVIRKQAQQLFAQQQTLAAQMPSALEHLQQAQNQLEHHQQQELQAKQDYANKRPLLNQVRALDIKLEHHHTQLQQQQELLNTQHQQKLILTQEQSVLREQLNTQQHTRNQVFNYLHNHAADAALVSELAGLQQRFKQLHTLNHTLNQQQTEHLKAQQQQLPLAQHYQQATQTLEQHHQQLDQLKLEAQTTEQHLDQTLQNKPLSQWRHTANQLKERLQALEQLQVLVIKRTELTELHQALEQTLLATQHQLKEHTQTLQLKQVQHETLELKFQSLSERQILEDRIRSLEQQRNALVDNQPCPLCGALDHPFARGQLPIQSDTAKALQAAKQELVQSSKAINTLQQAIVPLQTTLATQTERLTTYTNQLNTYQSDSKHLAQHLNLSLIDLSTKDLATLINTQSEQYQTTQNLIQTSESLEQQLHSLTQQLAQTQSKLQTIKEEQQQAEFACHTQQQTVDQLNTHCLALAQQLQQELVAISESLRPFQVNSVHISTLVETEHLLVQRRSEWIRHTEQQLDLNALINELTQQHNLLAERVQLIDSETATLQAQLTEQQAAYQQLQNQRYKLLATDCVDTLEQQLNKAIEEQEQLVRLYHSQHQTAQQALNTIQAQLQKVQQDQILASTQLDQLEGFFKERLQHSIFSSEAEYQAAVLPENERQRLNQQAQALQTEATELASKEQDKKLQLVTLQARALSEHPIAVLQEQCHTLQVQQRELLQSMGAIQQQLSDHHTVKQEQAKQLAAIEYQKNEKNRWDTLDELIGSSDGKKYRNFAQGLTFEIMIHHANRQLRKMSERYLLVRNSNQPLELNVVDMYQAGEIRSTRNLSGGESFLVSLALALGLSHMASQNVRVDSLFLDEGFGTLDQEALETALETLSNLQQEGKLIGIISHVQALQERISTQIRVLPQTGGRSRLVGVGCELIG